MLSVVVLGVVCELKDDDPGARNAPTVYFNLPPAPETTDETAAPVPSTVQVPRRRFRGQVEWVHTTVDQAPRWQRRLEQYRERRRKGISISFNEFADLNDGRRVIIRNDRGFGWSWRHKPGPWYGVMRDSLAAEVRDYLLAEEEDCCPVSPESVVEHLQRCYGLEVDAASARTALQLPRRVEFGTRLLRELSRSSGR